MTRMTERAVMAMTPSLNYLTPYEVASRLRLSYEKALAFIKYSGIKYTRIGRQYRVEERDLYAFLTRKGNVIVDLQSPIR